MIIAVLALFAAEVEPVNTDDTRRAMASYTACAMKRLGFQLRKLMDRPVSDVETNVDTVFLLDADCLKRTFGAVPKGASPLRFKSDIMRGSLYEAFYKKNFATLPEAHFDDLPPLKYPAVDTAKSPDADRYKAQMDMGGCIVRRAPVEVRAVLATEITTSAEREAMAALVPALSACATNGNTLSLSKSVVRGMIAEPLYRLIVAKRKMTNANS